MPTMISHAGSSLTECTYSKGRFLPKKMPSGKHEIDCELAAFDGTRQTAGTLNRMRDIREATYRGGRKDDTCDHGVSRS